MHGIGGIVGSIMTGLLASKTIGGVQGDVVTQLIGIVAVVAYSGAMTAVLLWVTKIIVGLRVEDNAEAAGLDLSQHREKMGA